MATSVACPRTSEVKLTSFGVIAEGVTDYYVIRSVLLGAFGAQGSQEPFIYRIFPREESATADGGWTVEKKFLLKREHLSALTTTDYLVVHIDTDVCDNPGFDVARQESGRALNPTELRERVIVRLKEWMGQDTQPHMEKIIFAVAVDAIECWLLPLLVTKPAKAKKTTGCLRAANDELRKRNRSTLSTGSGEKSLEAYRVESKPYQKYAELNNKGVKNPSLADFLGDLQARNIQLT